MSERESPANVHALAPKSHNRARHTRIRSALRGDAQPFRVPLAITPMIDVTFLLLIYFLLTTNFAIDEKHFRTALAPEDLTAMGSGLTLEQDPLRIQLSVGRPPRLLGPYRQPVDEIDLERFLSDALAIDGRTNALFRSDHPILVVPDSDVPWDHVVVVFDAIVRSGYTSVGFASP
ncbi:MAG: biopolymer transporter ExbD [Phycisphaerales bacterium]|nr:biopolymer transporter ExbD [Phycisphaerales bacterium]